MSEHEHEPEPGAGEQPTPEHDGDEAIHGGEPEHDDDAVERELDDAGDDAELAAQMTPEGEHVDEGEPGEPAGPPQPSEKEVEETYRKLDNETARHVKRVAELVGDDAFAFLVPCELCDPSMPGFRWPRPPADEVKAAVRMAIGDREPENWQADQYSRRCEACDGLGEVLTGSRVHGKGTLPCLACGGNGWTPIGNERGGNVVRLAPAGAPPDEQAAELTPASSTAPAGGPSPDEAARLRSLGYIVLDPPASQP